MDLDTTDPVYEQMERDFVEKENQQKAMVLSIVKAIQDLVTAPRNDDARIDRCNEICDAVIAFAFKRRLEPLGTKTPQAK